MKKLLVLIGLSLTLSCGADDNRYSRLSGDVADVEDYFTDRHVSGGDLQNFTNKIASDTDKGYVSSREKVAATSRASGDKVRATPSAAKQYATDKHITGGDFKKGTNQAADDAVNDDAQEYFTDRHVTGQDFQNATDTTAHQVGTTAQDAREYLDSRGGCEIKNGNECDTTERDERRKEDERLADRISGAEARIAAEEAKSAAQSLLIHQMQVATDLRFDMVEGRVSASEDEIEALRSDMEEADEELLAELGDSSSELEDMISDLSDYVDSENEDQDDTLADELSDLRDEIEDAENAAKLYAKNKVRSLRIRLNDRISRVKSRLNSKINRKVSRLNDRITRVKNRLKGKISDAEQAAKDYADANDSDTVFDPSALQAAIDTINNTTVPNLAQRVSDAEGAITALQNDSDLVCSVSTSSIVLHRKVTYYYAPHGHNHTSTQWSTVTIPTVTCPSQQP